MFWTFAQYAVAYFLIACAAGGAFYEVKTSRPYARDGDVRGNAACVGLFWPFALLWVVAWALAWLGRWPARKYLRAKERRTIRRAEELKRLREAERILESAGIRLDN